MNTNPNAKRILCFGDSNTWGYVSGTKHQRYPANIRWTGVLQNLLGNEYEIIEEGLNSRGILKGDDRPGKECRVAMDYILPCLDSHDPLDYVLIMLGSNELKSELNLSTKEIGENLKLLIQTIQNRPSQFRDIKPEIIIIVPPVLNENTEYSQNNNKYVGAYEKSIEFKSVYSEIAKEFDLKIVDVQDQMMVGVDGAHITEESHSILAKAIFNMLNNPMKTILVDAVYCIVSPEGDIFHEMHNLLETYPNKKIILTGADDEQFIKFELDKMPYEVFTLKHNPEKNDPQYFTKMLEHYNLTKDDVIYFEHNIDAVKSAESVGIKSYFYDDGVKDLYGLKVWLDENL